VLRALVQGGSAPLTPAQEWRSPLLDATKLCGAARFDRHLSYDGEPFSVAIAPARPSFTDAHVNLGGGRLGPRIDYQTGPSENGWAPRSVATGALNGDLRQTSSP